MKIVIASVGRAITWSLLLTAILALTALPSSASRRPLDKQQVDGLVRGGVASVRIAQLVRERGINFLVTDGLLKALEEEGAQKVLLDELRHTISRGAVKDSPPGANWGQAQAMRAEGKSFLDRRLWTNAESELRKSIQLNPADAAAHFYMGRALSEQGKLGDAIAAYRQAILLSPDTTPARFNLGNTLLKMGRWNEAAEAFRDALSLSPRDPKAHYGLGIALHHERDETGAISEFRKSLDLDPSNEEAHVALGLALAGGNNVEDAILEYRKALALNPRDAIAHADLASALVKTGNEEEALAELRAAMAIAPKDPRYHLSYDKLIKEVRP
ncbi:MAG: tetratricopeptide repeat protein [Acidobacteriota bacterium]|nr:tetratricopeptide repeat protein [Acidobacteriota bacterium]